MQKCLGSWFIHCQIFRTAWQKSKWLATTKHCTVFVLKPLKESSILPQCLVYDFLTNSGNVEEKSAKDAASGVYLGSFDFFFFNHLQTNEGSADSLCRKRECN